MCPHPQPRIGWVLSLSPKRRVSPDSSGSQGDGKRWAKGGGGGGAQRTGRDKDFGVCEEEGMGVPMGGGRTFC